MESAERIHWATGVCPEADVGAKSKQEDKFRNMWFGFLDSQNFFFNAKFIYVFSGRIKFSPKEITDVCECYDIEKNVWEIIDVKNK